LKQGEDIKRVDEVVGVVEEVLGDIERRFGIIDKNNSLQAGVMFEQIMESRGWGIIGGNHGGTNMSMVTGKMSVFDKLYSFGESSLVKVDSEGNVKHLCKKCGRWYMGDTCSLWR